MHLQIAASSACPAQVGLRIYPPDLFDRGDRVEIQPVSQLFVGMQTRQVHALGQLLKLAAVLCDRFEMEILDKVIDHAVGFVAETTVIAGADSCAGRDRVAARRATVGIAHIQDNFRQHHGPRRIVDRCAPIIAAGWRIGAESRCLVILRLDAG